MSYSPPHTFSSGTIIQASQVQQNLEAMQAYGNGGVVSGDLATAPWVETQHIVRPSFEATTRTLTAVSGVSSAAGRGEFANRFTYAQRATSKRTDDIAVWQFVPGTWREIELPRAPKAMLVQFSFGATTPSDSTVTTGTAMGFPGTDVSLVLFPGRVDSTSDIQSPSLMAEHRLQVEDNNGIGSSGVTRRDHQSGFELIQGVGNTLWSIGLVGRSTMPNTRIWRWSVVIEAWTV